MTKLTITNAAITAITPTLEKLMLSLDCEVKSVGELINIVLIEVAAVAILRLSDVEIVMVLVVTLTVELIEFILCSVDLVIE